MDNIPWSYSAIDWTFSLGFRIFIDCVQFIASTLLSIGSIGFAELLFDGGDSGTNRFFCFHVISGKSCGSWIGAFNCCSNRLIFFGEMKSEGTHASCQLTRQWESCWNICQRSATTITKKHVFLKWIMNSYIVVWVETSINYIIDEPFNAIIVVDIKLLNRQIRLKLF